jgi:lipopolysaccharide transport system ATP-binding protein
MSEIVLKAENISKQYRLGQLGTGTISHDLNRFWAKVRGKEDPYLRIGDANDRSVEGGSDYVWSLKDINFDVKRGEVLGIIGKNGAGKSTLLKILSQVTTPTTGRVKIKGRIAALLEVGTGFHPDLSGRENIFLNGAILGMSKKEIKSKLDEIVDFSGVAKYLDTPVKRYSSGMMVRLGFAVAAHLEPEILIVDEVLAVGDAEFQKKCMGKMKDVSGEGRTVLFVSHNMTAMKNLCQNGILLENGKIKLYGDIITVAKKYLDGGSDSAFVTEINFQEKSKEVQVLNAQLYSQPGTKITTTLDFYDPINLDITYKVNVKTNRLHLVYHIFDNEGTIVYSSYYIDKYNQYLAVEPGYYCSRIKVPNPMLKDGKYFIKIYIGNDESNKADSPEELLSFEIEDLSCHIKHPRQGFIYNTINWEFSPRID